MNRIFGIVILLAAGLAAPFAWAHTKSETHADWRLTGNIAHLTFTLPEQEAQRLKQGGESPANDVVAAYLAKSISVRSASGDCAPSPVRAAPANPGFRRFELMFSCANGKDLQLHSEAFFDLAPSHVTFAQITAEDGSVSEQLVTRDNKTISPGGESDFRDAGFFEYAKLGILHILTGPDHISFLLGLVLISRRLRDLVFVITGFTLGHSATLALAVTGLVRPHGEYIAALIGLTIALIGAENIDLASHRPRIVALGALGLLAVMALAALAGFGALPPILLIGAGIFGASYLLLSGHLRDAARLRLLVTLVFGLIHGFAFAGDLLELHMPADRLTRLLVGFNLGVEAGQLAIVAALSALGYAALRLRIAPPRPILVDTVSAGLVAYGVFLLVSGSFV